MRCSKCGADNRQGRKFDTEDLTEAKTLLDQFDVE